MKQCSIKNCENKHRAKGYCTNHYAINHKKVKTYYYPEYSAWLNMLARCYNPKYYRSEHYMGRGITVYSEWRNSYDAFHKYIGDKPGKGYSLDRINNDGNYEPGNVRWATMRQQRDNTRQTKNRFGYPGIKQNRNGKRWSVSISIAGKRTYLGRFDTIEEAIAARKQVELKHP